MTKDYQNLLINPQWLMEHKNDEDLVIVDCVANKHEYYRAHISGSIMRLGVPYVKSIDDFLKLSFLLMSSRDVQ